MPSRLSKREYVVIEVCMFPESSLILGGYFSGDVDILTIICFGHFALTCYFPVF